MHINIGAFFFDTVEVARVTYNPCQFCAISRHGVACYVRTDRQIARKIEYDRPKQSMAQNATWKWNMKFSKVIYTNIYINILRCSTISQFLILRFFCDISFVPFLFVEFSNAFLSFTIALFVHWGEGGRGRGIVFPWWRPGFDSTRAGDVVREEQPWIHMYR